MAPNFTRDNQPTLFWGPSSTPLKLRLRDYHPLRFGFPAVFGFLEEVAAGPKTLHPPAVFPQGFSLPYSRFARRYSGKLY